MDRTINHNHLFYFWLVGKHGNMTRAAKELGLSQPTVSAQIRTLEKRLGVALLARRGRGIELTEGGHTVFRYADEMFRISAEIPDALRGRFPRQPRTLHVGTSDFVPKPIIKAILEPLLKEDPNLRLTCREWRIDELLSELELFHLDLVIADRPHSSGSVIRTMSQPVFDTPMALYALAPLAKQLRRGFPRSLNGAALFLPVRNTSLRESLDRWFSANRIKPLVLAEFEDRELMKTFGGGGLAAFPAAAAIEQDIRRQYKVERVGWLRGIRETYFAITVQRRVMHPVVQRLFARANRGLLAAEAGSGRWKSASARKRAQR